MRIKVGQMKKLAVFAFIVVAAALPAYHHASTAVYAATSNSGAYYQAPTNDGGAKIYANNCSICHGERLEGILPGFPPLAGIGRQLSPQQITELVRHGKGRMPAFTKLTDDQVTEVVRFLDASQMVETKRPHSQTQEAHESPEVEMGGSLFQQNCAFCHGRDAGGGETGPDLTRSKLVAADVGGDKISVVVLNGRPEKKMPRFNFSAPEVASLAAFIHSQATKAAAMKGHRRGVDVSDLQTGNVVAGKQYFNSNCASCHSATGDLAGIASHYEGLELERRMLYPEDAKSKVTVTLPSGEKITGTLAYLDEFTVAMRDSTGTWRSWSVDRVKYSVDAPVNGHVELFSKYTDADIHNLMAYLQTLR